MDLLVRPQAAIRRFLTQTKRPWGLPILGYALCSFASGLDEVAATIPEAGFVVQFLLAAVVAALLGSWIWAGLLGGGAHLSARVLGGERGAALTIRAVGYGLLWPGALDAPVAMFVLLLRPDPSEVSLTALPFLLIRVGIGLWAMWMGVVALRSRHRFSWWRAICSWLILLGAFALLFGALFAIATTGRDAPDGRSASGYPAVRPQIDELSAARESSGTGPGEEEVFRVGDGVFAPELISKVEPEYSQEARDAKLQGTVKLAVEIWPDGRAHNVRVIRSLGMGLDQKAVEAVQQWRFVPGQRKGEPVKVAAVIEVNFRLL